MYVQCTCIYFSIILCTYKKNLAPKKNSTRDFIMRLFELKCVDSFIFFNNFNSIFIFVQYILLNFENVIISDFKTWIISNIWMYLYVFGENE